MPMYDFYCNQCGNKFTKLLWKDPDKAEVVCPECKSEEVKRLISAFASFGSMKSSYSASSCGGSGGFT